MTGDDLENWLDSDFVIYLKTKQVIEPETWRSAGWFSINILLPYGIKSAANLVLTASSQNTF